MQLLLRFFLVAIFCWQTTVAFSSVEEHPPRPLPELPIYDPNGKVFSLESLEGNVLILHFWASWCAQCKEEMIALDRFQKTVRKEPIIVIPIAEDSKGIEPVKQFYHENNIRYLLSFTDKNEQWFRQLNFNSLPVTLIINGRGAHVATIKGVANWNAPGQVEYVKRFILDKESLNQDYMALLDNQAKFREKPKPIEVVTAKPKDAERIPKEAITTISPIDPNLEAHQEDGIIVTNAE